jgi:pimeloyl-ACP methyl ester carboxylesterase
MLGRQAPPELAGIHTNMPGAVPPDVERAAVAGVPAPAGLTAEERGAYGQLVSVYRRVGYAALMGSRPQSLAALADSPVGLAAFMIDLEPCGYELIARTFAGEESSVSRDDVLDNPTLYWLTGTAISAARLYWENKLPYFAAKGVSVPAAVSVFPDELFQTPRSWAERAYPDLIHYHRLDRGGHFPAWEEPELFAHELRAALRSLRTK